MTIKEYLREYLSKSGNVPGTSIEVWEQAVQGKGKVTIEYSPETDKADIIHEGHNRRSDFYEADNAKDLKDIVEFCLGPVISDRQWRQSSSDDAVAAGDYEDELDY